MKRERLLHDTNENYDMSELCQKYDDAQAGLISEEEYLLYLIDILDSYIQKIIRDKYRFLGAEYEDLVSQGKLAIISEYKRYNPHKSRPSSFFTEYISQYTRDITNKGPFTTYYLGVKTRLDKAARDAGFVSMLDENLTPDTLHIIADVPLKTVLEVMKLSEITICSIDNCQESSFMNTFYKTPENSFIDKEKSELLGDIVSDLSPLMKYIILNIYVDDEPKTTKQIAKILNNNKKVYNLFKDDPELKGVKVIDDIFIKRLQSRALRLLRTNKKISNSLNIRKVDTQNEIKEDGPDNLDDVVNAAELEII